ncbi:MAG: basic amino acid ABC transporter substrate-binding protein [Cyanobacteria bacterium SBLK]|nr:basic amino acid ABC transporter substrate-binding protein [Cyanobacteria bacterium SBLK]
MKLQYQSIKRKIFNKKRFKKLGWIALIVTVCFLNVACDSITNNSEEKILLTVGIDPTFPPFEMREENNRIVGFDLDILRAIAEQEEIEITIDDRLAFNQLINALEQGEIDAIMSGMTITSKRAEKVEFSRPYFQTGLAITVRDEERKIQSTNDLKNKTIAVQIGTKGARKAENISGAKISQFSSIALALHELKNGNIDAVIHDFPAILYAIKIGNLDGLRIIEKLLTTEYYGIALPKDSEHIDRINDALEALIADRTYDDLYSQWFNSEPRPLPEIAPTLE